MHKIVGKFYMAFIVQLIKPTELKRNYLFTSKFIILKQNILQFSKKTHMDFGSQSDDSSTAENLLNIANQEGNEDDSDSASYSSEENIQQEKYFDCFKIVDLPIIQVKTGQEQEQILKQFKCVLFRFRQNEWKERSNHVMRFLRHKKSGKIRALMKSYKTFFIRASFYIQKVNGMCQLQKSEISQNTWTWKALDCSQGESKVEFFAAQFKEKQQFESFGSQFNFACQSNLSLVNAKQKQQQQKKQDQNLFESLNQKKQQ